MRCEETTCRAACVGADADRLRGTDGAAGDGRDGYTTGDRYAALTFDDGPSPTCTPILLDGLRERGVHATFFLIGSKIDGQEELVRRMQAEGHQIGNHSYDHVMLQKTDTASALRDLARCDAALQQLLGEGTYWVRPPYGFIS